jgi:excisionase family DNA binding protein
MNKRDQGQPELRQEIIMGQTANDNGNDETRIQRLGRQVPPVDDPAFLVTMPTLCSSLKLPLKWVRRETVAGRLPAIRVGKRVLFNVQAIQEFLRDQAAPKNQKGEWLQ